MRLFSIKLDYLMGVFASCALLFACSGGSSNGSDAGNGSGGDSLQLLSDEFDNDLSAWSILNPSSAVLQVNAGQLTIEPLANTLWFQNSAGVLLYQLVSGDFSASAYVTARRSSDSNVVPTNTNLGGLMAHDPVISASIQNYVHVALGALNTPIAEHKTTVNGISAFNSIAWPSGEGEIRICRIGDDFTMLVRERNGAWSVLIQFNRPDLPNTLQVGAMSYSGSNADLRVNFEYLRFKTVATSDDCTS